MSVVAWVLLGVVLAAGALVVLTIVGVAHGRSDDWPVGPTGGAS